jgi:hypothetical protein
MGFLIDGIFFGKALGDWHFFCGRYSSVMLLRTNRKKMDYSCWHLKNATADSTNSRVCKSHVFTHGQDDRGKRRCLLIARGERSYLISEQMHGQS